MMFRTKESHHRRAERSLDEAARAIITAREAVDRAEEHNGSAAEAHLAAIDWHREQHTRTLERSDEIALWKEQTHAA